MGFAVHSTRRVLHQLIPGFTPFELYRWPFVLTWRIPHTGWRMVRVLVRNATLMVQAVLEGYGDILAIATRVCSQMGLFGDLLLIPISLVWMFWPVYVPYRTGQSSLLF